MSNWSLINHLTMQLSRQREGDARHPALWPSEGSGKIINKHNEVKVVGKCRRSTFFRFATANYEFSKDFEYLEPLVMHLKKNILPTEPYLYWIWEAGNLFEEYVIDLAKASGVYIDSQIPVYMKDFNISGKLDLRVINPETHKLSIVEVKSVYGHNSKSVIPTAADKKRRVVPEPRSSNLIQIALYDWHWRKKHPDHEESRLVYGSRDTGRYSEFRINTVNNNGITEIWYRLEEPYISAWIKHPLTIDSILNDGYKYVTDHLLSGTVPERDFELIYSQDKILELHARGELNKAETEKVDKIIAREQENTLLEEQGKKTKKKLTPVIKGDWQCELCSYRNICYSEDGQPKEL